MTVAEVITVERRRRWKLAEKRQLVAEAIEPGASVSEVAKRHGLHPSQLFAWKKLARDGGLSDEDAGIGPSELVFTPVVVRSDRRETTEPAARSMPMEESPGPVGARRGRMEIALKRGCRITVFADVDGGALARVLDVLDRR